MARLSGIPLVDLFDTADSVASAMPQSFQNVIDRFVVVDYRSSRSPAAIMHHGQLQSFTDSVGADVEEIDLGLSLIHI